MFRRAEQDAHLITKMIAKMWPPVSSIADVVAFCATSWKEKISKKKREKELLNKKKKKSRTKFPYPIGFAIQFSVYLASIAGNVSACKGGKMFIRDEC